MKLLDILTSLADEGRVCEEHKMPKDLWYKPVWSQLGMEGRMICVERNEEGRVMVFLFLDSGAIGTVPADSIFMGVRDFKPVIKLNTDGIGMNDRRKRRVINRLAKYGLPAIQETMNLIDRWLDSGKKWSGELNLERFKALLYEAGQKIMDGEG